MKKRQAKKQGLKVNINGKEETIHEGEYQQEEKQEGVTFSNWEEKRQAEQESAASSEEKPQPQEEDFHWDEAADHIYHSDPKVVKPYKKKKNGAFDQKLSSSRGPIKRVMTTVLFAVVLGTGLGVFALSLSQGSTPDTQAGVEANASTSMNQSPVKAGDTPSDDQEQKQEAKGASSGSYSTFVVQTGKFSSEKGAEELVGSLKDAGYAGKKVAMDDGFYVIAGLAKNQEMTSSVGKALIDENFEAWGGKELSFNVPTELSDVIEKAAILSSKVITGEEFEKQELTQLTAKVEEANTSDQAAKEELLKAIQLLEDPSVENGWKTQQVLLDQLNT
ncbi:SPOR domain-containing protein [Bacillus sp. NPDC077027]|uniref:SPOR domain-containing protein n=1 Tax=Bacillus sp. NPDC077027 TaxID=3390548 RepID=UPI003D01F901